jgi:outer membrane protein
VIAARPTAELKNRESRSLGVSREPISNSKHYCKGVDSMKQIQSHVALLCVLLVFVPLTFAQEQRVDPPTAPLGTQSPKWYSGFVEPYRWRLVSPISLSNSGRLDSLMRGGNLYLSLDDTIALTLENNIDVEVQRYTFALANTDMFRVKATGSFNGVSTAAPTTTTGIGTSNFLTSSGATGAATPSPSSSFLSASPSSYDPVFTSTVQWGHQTTPNSSTVLTGTTSSINTVKTGNFAISDAWFTGTGAALTYNNNSTLNNSPRSTFNPSTNSSLDLQLTQHLLQGRSFAVNTRNIRIARNNLRVTDLVFEQQIISTVANVVQLYWNLVAANENVRVMQQTLEYSQKLYKDNMTQVEIGTLAPVEVTRADAEVAADTQNLITAQTNVLQQETVLKNALSRTGVADQTLADAHIIPTSVISIPNVEPLEPIQDLTAKALQKRPELTESRVQVDSARISLTGVRAAMLPTIDAIADLRNNALSGIPNPLLPTSTNFTAAPDPFFVGGYGNILSQLFGRNFPNYSVGVQLTVPLRNRAAEANAATAQLNLRMTELGVQRLINMVRLDVQNALIALRQARVRYDAAVKNTLLEEQLYDAEQKKFQIGTSTGINVIQVQRDLATARQNEVTALNSYALARVQMDQATGTVLETNHVELDEAKTGKVTRSASPIPETNPGGGAVGGGANLRR